MSLWMFDTDEFKQLAEQLRLTDDPSQFEIIVNNLSDKLHGIRIIASFPHNKQSSLPSFKFPSVFSWKYFVPYLHYPFLYYHNHSTLLLPANKTIDYTVTFDTNVASYLKSVVQNQTLGVLTGDIQQTFDYILSNNLNFDPLFYFIENIKLAHPIALRLKNKGEFTPSEFWNSLNQYFRSNMVCLQLFINIDTNHYKNTRSLKFTISLQEAEKIAIDFAYNFYASPQNSDLAKDTFFPLQRLILLQLIAMVRIQFASNENAKSKFKQFMNFVQEQGIVYLERETVVALEYFKDRSNVPMFDKVNRGGDPKTLLKRFDNIAWDFTAARFIETLFAVRMGADYYIPFFLSFDKNLRDLFKIYPTKAVVIDDNSGYVHSVPSMDIKRYFTQNDCFEIMEEFSSFEKSSNRRSRLNNNDRDNLIKIRAEYKNLRSVW